MSFCRWSSDDFACDLYIYEDVSGGWTIHVARNRIIYKSELPEQVPLIPGNEEAWMNREAIMEEKRGEAERVMIDLPHAGETFNESTREATIERVRSLRALGYRCPDRVEKRLLAEIEEESTTPSVGETLAAAEEEMPRWSGTLKRLEDK